MVSVNARFTDDTDVSNSAESGFRNTLHAYTAPSATCITTPATAISQRFVTFSGMIDPQRLCGLNQCYPPGNGATPLTHHARRRGRSARPRLLRSAGMGVQHG